MDDEEVMPRANIYRVEAWDNDGPGGASGSRFVTLAGIGKPESGASPYCVFHEYAAYRLGLFVDIPIPPGAVVEGPTTGLAWVSLRFAPKGSPLPPIFPAEVVAAVPKLAASVVAFDLLIINTDRHAGNLSYLPSQKRLEVFDHERAFMGDGSRPGVERYHDSLGSFAIGGASGNRQCLLDHVDDSDLLIGAAETMAATLTDPIIRSTFEAASAVSSVSDIDAAQLAELVIRRRDSLVRIIRESRDQFPGIPPSSWSAL